MCNVRQQRVELCTLDGRHNRLMTFEISKMRVIQMESARLRDGSRTRATTEWCSTKANMVAERVVHARNTTRQ